MCRWILFYCFYLITMTGWAQEWARMEVPMADMNGTSYSLSVGGLNTPQVSNIDLDNDGMNDLVIFERSGNVWLPFLVKNIGPQVYYFFAPEYQDRFPTVRYWALLKDYNNDGLMDIFSMAQQPGQQGVEVYKGTMNSGDWGFERVTFSQTNDLLPYVKGNQFFKIPVATIDIPDFNDLDGDGDLDMLTFDPGGGSILYFKNLSVELNHSSKLYFEEVDDCWGKLYESGISTTLALSPTADECASGLVEPVTSRHIGSTLVTMDYTNDGLMDLLLGDVSFPTMTMAVNGGTKDEAWVTSQIVDFPQGAPVDLYNFPAGFHVDVNGSTIRDLLVANNENGFAENVHCLWYYENMGTDTAPNFVKRTDQFLVSDMIDVGFESHPQFVDVDGDGLMDLLIANGYEFIDNARSAYMHYYRNVGTADAPSFQLVDKDFASFSTLGSQVSDLVPAFGDLDSDGDLDMVVGQISGDLIYYENIAGAGNMMTFATPQIDWMGIDPGGQAAPELYDVDKDGLLDIIIGEVSGNLNFFKNIGTATNPLFGDDQKVAPNTDTLGHVDVRDLSLGSFVSGFSYPKIITVDGEDQLLVGTQSRGMILYEISSDVNGYFPILAENFGAIHEGDLIAMDVMDINNDGFLDAVVGNMRGGIVFYTSDRSTSTQDVSIQQAKVYPNPGRDHFRIESQTIAPSMIRVFNASGQLIHEGDSVEILTQSWTPGIYYIQLIGDNGIAVTTWVKI